jgi:hypothetical protein
MDVLLQDIYRTRSRLVVVFIGAQYRAREWSGLEFCAIRDVINRASIIGSSISRPETAVWTASCRTTAIWTHGILVPAIWPASSRRG